MKIYPLPLIWLESSNQTIEKNRKKIPKKIGPIDTTWGKSYALTGQKQQKNFP